MYGTVSGINCRKSICKLRQAERLKGRFGIYLAKDFIPFSKKSTLINEKSSRLKTRIKEFNNLEKLNIDNIAIKRIPDNEAQVVLLLSSLLSNEYYKSKIEGIDSIAHYSFKSNTDLIYLNKEGSFSRVRVPFK